MSFANVIRTLNSLRRRRIIKDYALIGSVGATAYLEPMFTAYLDIIVLADTDAEYLQTFRQVSELAEGTDGMHLIFDDVPVQLFPSNTKPLYRDALDNANSARVGNLRVKVASPEHLTLLALDAFRPVDRVRIHMLLDIVDKRKLRILLREFDDETKTLTKRLDSIC